MTRVLVVEDEPALARGLGDHFRDEGYEVRLVARGDQAVAAVREFRPQLVVLDVLLPGRSGLDVLRDLRGAGDRVPVLMLTAKGEVVDRVVGLELGADDYLAKPFALRELLARVHALLRRSQGSASSEPDEVTIDGVTFDLRGMTARGRQGTIDLTPHDILVFKVLALRRGEVVPRVDIVEEVCGLESEATLRKVDNHVMALRRALGDDPRNPRWIHTVRGHGYRLSRAEGD
jgi:DNA-binding response OmpR family regulator